MQSAVCSVCVKLNLHHILVLAVEYTSSTKGPYGALGSTCEYYCYYCIYYWS